MGEQGVRFGATFHGAGLHATGTVADDVIGKVLPFGFDQTRSDGIATQYHDLPAGGRAKSSPRGIDARASRSRRPKPSTPDFPDGVLVMA